MPGMVYANGVDVVRDFERALLWYRKTVENGLAAAQYLFGTANDGRQAGHREGPRDIKVAERGSAPVQYALGEMSVSGRGVDHDLSQGAGHRISSKLSSGSVSPKRRAPLARRVAAVIA